MTRLKQNLTGLGPVLRFSFAQLFKAKGNLITLGIFMLLALVSVPAASLFSSGTASVPAPEPDYEYAAPEPGGEHLSVSYSIVSRSGHLGASDSGAGYFVQLVYSILVMMISLMSVSYIIGAVAEEKTSKLVELLMVSVKPLALIAGKILSVMLYMLTVIVLVALCFALSNAFSMLFLHTGVSFLSVGGAQALSGLGAGALAAALVSLALGYLTFAIAAGLFGAGCSSTEDTQSAAGGCTVLILLAYFVSVVAGSAGGPFATVCSLVPVLSVFCAPAQYAMGELSLPLLCLSWVIQAVCVAALAVLCARIYAGLLIYRGSRVTLRQMLRMARGGREAV